MEKQALKEKNVVLTDEQLAAVTGGIAQKGDIACPKCGGFDVKALYDHDLSIVKLRMCKCMTCGHRFYVE